MWTNLEDVKRLAAELPSTVLQCRVTSNLQTLEVLGLGTEVGDLPCQAGACTYSIFGQGKVLKGSSGGGVFSGG